MGRTIGLIMALQDKCSPNIKKIANQLNMSEKEAKRLNAQIGKLSKDLGGKLKGACVAVGAGFSAVVATAGVLVNKSMEAGDRIDKMSQKIGMSRASFQKWDYVLSQSGTDIEKMQVGMKTMSQQMVASTKQGSEAQKMFQKLGVSVKDSNGNFKSQEQAFEEVIRAFQKMPDGIEKANMAQKLFGKTGSDLRPLLNGVRGDIDELNKKYEQLGLGMSNDAIDASVKLKDTIDTLQRAFSAFGFQIGAELMPTIQSLADELIAHLPQIKATLTPVLQGLTNTIKFVIEHFKGLSVIASAVLGTMIAYKTISTTIATMQLLTTAIQSAGGAMQLFNAICAKNPIGLIALAVGGLIALLTALVMNWDKVTEAVGKAINAIKKFFHIKGKTEVETKDGTKVKKNAVGTSYFSGGTTRINEFGGEIVDLPQGSRIIPHDISETMAKNSGGGLTVNVYIAGNMIGNNEFLNQLTDAFARKLQSAMAVR